MELQNCFIFSTVVFCIVEITYDGLNNTNCIVPSCKIQNTFVSLQITLVFLRYLVKFFNIKLHKNYFLKEPSLETVRKGDERAERGTDGRTWRI